MVYKFTKGQVWYVHEDLDKTEKKIRSKDRTMAKSRPYLIVSDTECIEDTGIILCVPMTSTIGVVNPDIELIIRDIDMTQRKIKAFEVSSKDSNSFSRYLYTVDEETMRNVDKIIYNRIGFSKTLLELENKVKEAEEHLEKLKLEALGIIDTVSKSSKTSRIITVDKKEESAKVEYAAKRGRRKWTDESAQQFMDDYKNLSKDELIKKYNLRDKKQIQSMYGSCWARLKNMKK